MVKLIKDDKRRFARIAAVISDWRHEQDVAEKRARQMVFKGGADKLGSDEEFREKARVM